MKSISINPVYDLNTKFNNLDLNNIYSTINNQEIVAEFIHEQFTDNAEIYQQKYTNHEHFSDMLSNSFSIINETYNRMLTNEKMIVLDIGSGSGNSIFPLLDLCPNAKIIASDLSINLLKLLRDYSLKINVENRLILLQLNAEEINLKNESLDLVVGASILHHLFSPEKTIKGCFNALKPEGYAIFYEPFEIGSMMIRLIFKDLLLRTDWLHPLSKDIANFFKAIIKDYEYRMGNNKNKFYYKYMEDKWLFSKKYFENLAKENGFSDCIIYSLRNGEDKAFENQIDILLKLGLGKSLNDLSNWAIDKIREYDSHLTIDVKRESLTEGCVILKK